MKCPNQVQRAQEERDHSGMPRLHLCAETSDEMHKQACQEMRKCELVKNILRRIRLLQV